MSDAAQRAARWVRPEFLADAPYHVPDIGDVVKLDANESPWAWPEELKAAWLERLNAIELNRYPDAPASQLCDALRERWDVSENFDILAGNGSDECIQIVASGVAGPGRIVMAPEPTFVVYERTARLIGSKFVGVPLTERFELDTARMIDAVAEHDPACVFFAWPNNPTGNLFDRDALEKVIENTDGLVVVDEAYGAFSGQSFLADLGAYPNVVIMRTLSKIGMAGIRLGALIGDPAWIGELHKIRMPYNVNSLTQESAVFALENYASFAPGIESIREQTRWLTEQIKAMPGLDVFPSDANFFLIRVSHAKGVIDVHKALLDRGIAVKNFHRPDTPLDSCLRVSTGRPEQNKALVMALKDIVG